MHTVYHRHAQHTHTIFHTAAEVDTGCLFKIFGRAGYFRYIIAIHKHLREHLVIKHKIVAVVRKIYGAYHLRTKGPVARMVFTELLANNYILKLGQAAVEDVFINRHTTF